MLMKQTHGYLNGHYWAWSQEYGLYLCTDLPTQACAGTIEGLERAIGRQVDEIIRERNITLEQYIDEREPYLTG